MSRMKSLIEEARTLATLINTDRFLGVVPSADLTVRLTEVTDLMMDICIGGDPDAMMEEDDTDDGTQCYINGKPVSEKEFVDSYR